MKKIVTDINNLIVTIVLALFYITIIGTGSLIKRILPEKGSIKANASKWLDVKEVSFKDFESSY